MKRMLYLLVLLIFLLGAVSAALMHPSGARALPEYAAQTGEPCATCHISPSGGGPRGPRGQAWVGEGKPGAVPSLVDALEALGVKLESDPQDFQASGAPVPPARPLLLKSEPPAQIHDWLKNYDGN